MSPKEKAGYLCLHFAVYDKNGINEEQTKIFAWRCVDEIRDNLPLITEIQQYWLDVKKEITLI